MAPLSSGALPTESRRYGGLKICVAGLVLLLRTLDLLGEWRALLTLACLFQTLLLNGCSSSPGARGNETVGSSSSLPPVFLSGPAAVLLTNRDGFSAHIVLSHDSASPLEKNSSGELLGREGKLLFAPEQGKREKKYSSAGFSFISDVGKRQSFVLSEALQGYAPASMEVGATNVAINTKSTTDKKIDGHMCELEEATVAMSDGSHGSFQVLRAADLKGFPLRISSISNTAPFTVSFSKIRIESPSAELFAPPRSFTKYDNVEMMVTELILRQHKLKGGPAAGTEPVHDYRNR